MIAPPSRWHGKMLAGWRETSCAAVRRPSVVVGFPLVLLARRTIGPLGTLTSSARFGPTGETPRGVQSERRRRIHRRVRGIDRWLRTLGSPRLRLLGMAHVRHRASAPSRALRRVRAGDLGEDSTRRTRRWRRAMNRSIQRWRWLARVGDHKRPHGIVDRWTERSLMAASEWEIRAARASAKPVDHHSPRLGRAIDRFAGKAYAAGLT